MPSSSPAFRIAAKQRLVDPNVPARNVLLMDEPTNHLDMESIESLNTGLEKFPGTLVFVSHDREFVSSLATRIIEIRQDHSIIDYRGTYEEYLASQGIE